MKYIRGNQTSKLEDCELTKIHLVDDEDFNENIWAKILPEGGFVLQNQALAFTPNFSWGAIIPNTHFNFLEILKTQELTLHPEAYDYALERNWIDKEGNALEVLK